MLIAFGAFIAIVVVMVAISLSQKVDLVADHYYERSLEHEQRILSASNARRLGKELSVQTIGDELLVSFPPAMRPSGIVGNCVFYRPSDRSLDRVVVLQVDSSGVQRVSLGAMRRGLWKAQLSWYYSGEQYYLDTPIVLQ